MGAGFGAVAVEKRRHEARAALGVHVTRTATATYVTQRTIITIAIQRDPDSDDDLCDSKKQ
jgi:hypothetical protein